MGKFNNDFERGLSEALCWHVGTDTHTQEVGLMRIWLVICRCCSFPLSGGLILPVSSVPLQLCHNGVPPPHLSGVATRWSPSGSTSSLSEPGAVVSRIHLSIAPSIYTSCCSVRLWDEVMILLLFSALLDRIIVTATHVYKAAGGPPYSCILSYNSGKLRCGEVNESLNLTLLLWSPQWVTLLKPIRGIWESAT